MQASFEVLAMQSADTAAEFFYIDDPRQQKIMKVVFAGSRASDNKYNILLTFAVVTEANNFLRCLDNWLNGQKFIGAKPDMCHEILNDHILKMFPDMPVDHTSQDNIVALDAQIRPEDSVSNLVL